MPTFLTNDKMSPELRARIEASVTGRPVQVKRAPSPRLRVALRVATAMIVAAGVFFFFHQRRAAEAEIASRRAGVREALARTIDRVDPRAAALTRVDASLRRELSATYPGDFAAPALAKPDGLATLLARPALYVRGEIDELADPARAAAASRKDALLRCLVSPPPSTKERAMLHVVRAAHAQRPTAALEGIHRLDVVVRAKPFFAPGFREQVQEATTRAAVATLEERVKRARLERAARAAAAEVLIYVADEPKEKGTISEIDGACAHFVRLGVVDLKRDETLWRVRRKVDPAWISEDARVSFARGLNGCRFATEAVAALSLRSAPRGP